jgi:hypothetical protein
MQEEFVDAGLGHNNPSKELMTEAKRVFGTDRQVQCILNIGTGSENIIQLPSESSFFQNGVPKDLIEVLKVWQRIARRPLRKWKRGTRIALDSIIA